MSKKQRASDFLESAEGIAFVESLKDMTADKSFYTPSMYSASSESNDMSFVDKHINYIRKHPDINPKQYLSNLRVMTRVRR